MDGETFLKMVERFKESAVPVSQEIFKDIGKRPGGVKFLVDLRGFVLVGTNVSALLVLKFISFMRYAFIIGYDRYGKGHRNLDRVALFNEFAEGFVGTLVFRWYDEFGENYLEFFLRNLGESVPVRGRPSCEALDRYQASSW